MTEKWHREVWNGLHQVVVNRAGNAVAFDVGRHGDLIAATPDLLALAESVEWVSTGRDQERECPWCKESRDDGHANECPRQAALIKARGGSE